MTGETRIAGTLRQFDDAVKELSSEEQCGLTRLIVREIRVNRLAPGKEPIPGGLSPEERKYELTGIRLDFRDAGTKKPPEKEAIKWSGRPDSN